MDRLVQGYQSAALLLFTSWQLLNASWGPTWPRARDPATQYPQSHHALLFLQA